MRLRQLGYEDMNWIEVIKDRVWWWVLIMMALKF